MVAAALQKLNYPLLLDLLQKFSPMLSGNPLPTQKWDPVTLEHVEVAHRSEGELLRLSRLEKERIQKEVTERAEASRLEALHRARQKN